jgi:hypothetical protein
MSKRIFTPEEQSMLLKNTNVASCSNKSIAFTAAFKQLAVRAYREDGRQPYEIFLSADIPPTVIGHKAPNKCLHRWLAKDETSLSQDGRGKHGKAGRRLAERSDMSKMTEREQIEYLKLRIAYTDAENDFLAKLRGIKRVPFVYRPKGDTN